MQNRALLAVIGVPELQPRTGTFASPITGSQRKLVVYVLCFPLA